MPVLCVNHDTISRATTLKYAETRVRIRQHWNHYIEDLFMIHHLPACTVHILRFALLSAVAVVVVSRKEICMVHSIISTLRMSEFWLCMHLLLILKQITNILAIVLYHSVCNISRVLWNELCVRSSNGK